MNNTLKGRNQIILAICVVLVAMIMILAVIAFRQKPATAKNDNTETQNVIDTEDDTMTMVADGDDAVVNDSTEAEDVSDAEDSETKEDEKDSQAPSSEEDEKDDSDDKSDDNKKDDEADDKKDDDSDDKKEPEDTDDGKDDVDDSEEKEEPKDSEEEEEAPADEEDEHDISPSEQMLIDAGYGVVIKLPTGNYGVLTHGNGYANGKFGFDILEEYLATLDLEAVNISGSWIDESKDYYMFVASNLRELITEDEEEFWD